MATEPESEPLAGAETSEKPVREQLRNASISKAKELNSTQEGSRVQPKPAEENGERNQEDESRGRMTDAACFDDKGQETKKDKSQSQTRSHTRKRSRDSTVEEEELNNGQRKSGERSRDEQDPESVPLSNGHSTSPVILRPSTPEQATQAREASAAEPVGSPKLKRTRLDSASETNATYAAPPATDTTASESRKPANDTAIGKLATAIPPSSGFANTSAASPFASLSGSKSPEPTTSSSAFAASGFSSLSGKASGFGVIGKSSGGFGAGGGFGSGINSPLPSAKSSSGDKSEDSKDSTSISTFGGALGQQSAFSSPKPAISMSGFGSTNSGFGSLGQSNGLGGSAFGSGASGLKGFGGGGGLTSFASAKPAAASTNSSKPLKAFGAPVDNDDEGENEDDGEDEHGAKSPLSKESDRQDERFYQQDVETGEEDELTEFSCRAKLYNFTEVTEGKKEWKERGLGVLRLNVGKIQHDAKDLRPKARLLMRADGSHRVILNTPVKKEIKFGTPKGEAPSNGYLYFMGTVDGKEGLELLQLKVGLCPIPMQPYEHDANELL